MRIQEGATEVRDIEECSFFWKSREETEDRKSEREHKTRRISNF